LDIPLLPHVVNFELPNISEDYIHRIGRTGRAGASGEAISLVSADEKTYLRDIEKLVGMRIPNERLEGFEPIEQATEEQPKQQQRPQGNPSRSNNNRNRNRNRNNRPQRNNDRRPERWN
jgi:ATP-dependent RNA helicase RhlE